MFQGYKIFVIDDNTNSLEMTKQFLISYIKNKWKYFPDISTHSNPKKAFEEITKQEKVLVFTDIDMPEMTGLDIASGLKNKDHCYVVIISAHSEFEYAQIAMEQAAVSYLLKPIIFRDLDSVFELILKRMNQTAYSQNSWIKSGKVYHCRYASGKIISLPDWLGCFYLQILLASPHNSIITGCLYALGKGATKIDDIKTIYLNESQNTKSNMRAKVRTPITNVIKEIRKHDIPLASHLESAIIIGADNSVYLPEPKIQWKVK